MQRDEEWLLNEKYLGERTEEFFADCERLKNGEPLAYVIGHVPFLDTTIWLDSRPLIPRAETEYWVKEILDTMNPSQQTRVLDLCAGSGCIGVAVLKALPQSRVDFVEIDTEHHSTIIQNIRWNDIVPTRARIFGGDLFQNVTDSYDLILSNPPYINKTLNRTETSVIDHEPHTALFAEDGGFALIERIITEAPAHLTETGTLVIEHEPEHVERIQALASQNGFTALSKNDQYGVARYTILSRR